jgi:phosphoribosylformylglycinamidine cyclo-ligase
VLGGVGGSRASSTRALLGYTKPLLATSTDGVGTKVAIAQAIDKHDTIGQDLVGMVVDDIVVVGAKPLFMTDYIACGKVFPERIADIVRGIATGCELTGTALVGGETAEHPGLLGVNDYDVGGGDRHRRGGRRARRRARAPATSCSPWHPAAALQRVLARPSHRESRRHHLRVGGRGLRSHVGRGAPRADPPLHAAAPASARRDPGGIHSLSHVTGGGIAANLARVLPKGSWVDVDRPRGRRPVFRVLADLGGLAGEHRGHLEPRHRVLRRRRRRPGGCRDRDPPRGGHRHVAGRGRAHRRGARDGHGDFEQGAKGVDGGAVRLVGSYSTAN